MPPLPLLTLLIAALTVAGEPAKASPRHQPLVAAFAGTPENQRGEWVNQTVLGRIRRASEIALSAENLALQRRFVGIVESRLRGGEQLSEAGLLTLLRKMESLEQLATRKLVARYEQKLVELFTQPRDRDLRMRAWQKVQDAWSAAGEPLTTEDQLIAWLDGAITRLDRGPTAKLPAVPMFDSLQAAPVKPTRNSIGSVAGGVAKPPHTVQRPLRTVEPRLTNTRQKPAVETIPSPGSDVADVDVNVDELNSHIAGYNLAAASITAKLAATEHPSIDLISAIVGELEELSQRHNTLTLYIGLLDPTDAQLIGVPKPLDPIVAVVASKIFSLRQQIDGDKHSEAESTRLRERLTGLSKRLAELASAAPESESPIN